jgi:cardiolipin synthase C
VRILTNSLESTPDLIAQSGYLKYRIPLLKDGVELYELRALLGNTRGSGQTAVISRYGNYALHAKLFVFDREKLFVGSMNFDQRSKHGRGAIGRVDKRSRLRVREIKTHGGSENGNRAEAGARRSVISAPG